MTKYQVYLCQSSLRLFANMLPVHSYVLSMPFMTWVYLLTTIFVRPLMFGQLSCCFAALCRLRRYIIDDCFCSLVVSLVHSRLDYGNFVLVGRPVYLQWRLQSVLNTAARLVFRLGRYDHVSYALATLHWLRLSQSVDLKVAVMAFHVLHGLAPPYLNDPVHVADLPGRRRLCSSSSHQLLVSITPAQNRGSTHISSRCITPWNSLPSDIQSSPSLPVFHQRLKTFLFS